MIIKDFDRWNEWKKKLHLSDNTKRYYHEREIWWCSLGINIGYEHDGKGVFYQRPILILKALSANTCLVVPITSSPIKHKLRIEIGYVNEKNASAVISQMRVVDTRRLVKRIGYLEMHLYNQVRKAAKDLL